MDGRRSLLIVMHKRRQVEDVFVVIFCASKKHYLLFVVTLPSLGCMTRMITEMCEWFFHSSSSQTTVFRLVIACLYKSSCIVSHIRMWFSMRILVDETRFVVEMRLACFFYHSVDM